MGCREGSPPATSPSSGTKTSGMPQLPPASWRRLNFHSSETAGEKVLAACDFLSFCVGNVVYEHRPCNHRLMFKSLLPCLIARKVTYLHLSNTPPPLVCGGIRGAGMSEAPGTRWAQAED